MCHSLLLSLHPIFTQAETMSKSCFVQLCATVLLLPGSSVFGLKMRGVVGQSVTLPCNYSTGKYGVIAMCWGRGICPTSQCTDMILSTDGLKIKKSKSSRYQLYGNLSEGNVSLTIENVTEADSGVYCCRVEITGIFNDLKEHFDLTIEKALNKISTLAPGNQMSEHYTGGGDFSLTSAPVSSWKISVSGQESHNTHVTSKSSDTLVSSSAVPQTTSLAVSICIPLAGFVVLLLLIVLFFRRCYKKRVKTQGKSSFLFSSRRESGDISALQVRNQIEDNIYI
ncbi:hepatitis A virus cellular receptor 1 homolog [Microcaecilia unicolor]|uniref:Hepatitis A virus cellular receptor 2 n=1 Tax=Microcaecilia unicolor TaxID=1415580 RepID=A0A6P7YX52_9AMPH|nr:hepatitis A virus cellular receptor 2 [Microcaecilia unicolor]